MKITRYTPVNKGNLVAFCSILITDWDFYINDISIYMKNCHRWINFPSRKYTTEEGDKYSPYCGYLTRELKEQFEVKLFKALDVYAANNQSPVPDDRELPF